MTVNISGDSSWTVTDVNTGNSSGTVDITARRMATNEYIDLTIRNYHPGNLTYIIDQGGGIGTNINQSSGFYSNGTFTVTATTGQIMITSETSGTMIGSFNFTNNYSGSLSGTFTAPLP